MIIVRSAFRLNLARVLILREIIWRKKEERLFHFHFHSLRGVFCQLADDLSQ